MRAIDTNVLVRLITRDDVRQVASVGELKFQDAPRLTPSIRIALERLTVLYPGDLRYDLEERVAVVPLAELATHGADAVLTGSRPRTRGK